MFYARSMEEGTDETGDMLKLAKAPPYMDFVADRSWRTALLACDSVLEQPPEIEGDVDRRYLIWLTAEVRHLLDELQRRGITID